MPDATFARPDLTTFARLVHGTLPPEVQRYSRHVTIAWTVFFATLFVASCALYLAKELAAWSDVANITFTRVDDGTGYSNNATMLFGNYSSGSDGGYIVGDYRSRRRRNPRPPPADPGAGAARHCGLHRPAAPSGPYVQPRLLRPGRGSAALTCESFSMAFAPSRR